MPVNPTYPGVYVEEIPSGVRTIVGVATSITAFIGRDVRGPVNEPITINNFGDFERLFGGLHLRYPMSYAVKDFYMNGGSQAIIVRLFQPIFETEADREAALAEATTAAAAVAGAASDAVDGASAPQDVADAAQDAVADAGAAGDAAQSAAEAVAQAASEAVAGATEPRDVADAAQDAVADAAASAAPTTKAGLSVDSLSLEAAYEGDWANGLLVRVDHDVAGDLPWLDRYGLSSSDLFNLTVRDTSTGDTETFLNVTVEENSQRPLNMVLENGSRLIRVSGELPDAIPPAHASLEAGDSPWDEHTPPYHTAVDAEAAPSQPLTNTEDWVGDPDDQTGMYALKTVDLFNLLCIPPDTLGGDTPRDVYDQALNFCEAERAMLIVDPPAEWGKNKTELISNPQQQLTNDLGLTGLRARNAALYVPRVRQSNPLREGQIETFVPCGIIAGVMARTDTQRGVWKTPGGTDATLNGIRGLQVKLTDEENGQLNPVGINCLRTFPIFGQVVWGGRTLRGADQLADEYKYVSVRRTALFIEESLFRGLKWVVFEPNDEPLWASIRLNVGAFMQNLFRQGAFQGSSPRQAYFVKCDSETTTQNHINLGIVNIVVGFAPLKPAEFVIIKIQQMAGQIET